MIITLQMLTNPGKNRNSHQIVGAGGFVASKNLQGTAEDAEFRFQIVEREAALLVEQAFVSQLADVDFELLAGQHNVGARFFHLLLLDLPMVNI